MGGYVKYPNPNVMESLERHMKNHASFVSSNPWPEEKVVMDFISNPRNKYQHNYPELKIDGPKFYRHDLAKALWQVGSILNSVEKRAAYHNIGWQLQIKEINGNLAKCDEIKRCMWV